MSATGSGHMSSFSSRSGLPTFGNFGSTLLERSNPGLRKSTPDSDALASSDEEVEQSRLRSAQRKTISNRRSSLLSDQNHGDSRQIHHPSSLPYSPSTGSQPNTPSVSQDTWSSISPGASTWNTASAYPFGPNIWGANSRDPPSRLQEVKQDSTANKFPFSISPQPNPTVQRSMSFSVGQSDYEPTSAFTSASTIEYPPRSIPGLTRRSSRPANMGHEFSGLARVNESDDPENYQATAPPSMSNISGRSITRTLSSTSTPTNHSLLRSSRPNLHHPDLDFNETAIEEYDDTAEMQRATREPRALINTRRNTDNYMSAPLRQPTNPSSNNVGFASNIRQNTTWTTITSNDNLYQQTASRRHSFADMPVSRASPTGMALSLMPHIPEQIRQAQRVQVPVYQIPDYRLTMTWTDDPDTYEDAPYTEAQIKEQLRRERENLPPAGGCYFAKNEAAKSRTEQAVARQLAGGYDRLEPPRNMGEILASRPLYAAKLDTGDDNPDLPIYYVINFKCCRSEIFRLREGATFTIKEGDLVIVEADRGEDLGCVMHGPMDKHIAERYKLKYSEQHFGWLMMFTAQAHSGSDNPYNPNAAFAASPAKGPLDKDVNKSKRIKRPAAPFELEKLQHKEGHEAKAKRECQGKVDEHGFNMEILDAEYQLDMRKLTFYFFSTEYINFNVLVTDLFKKFKTRIWLFAINPASFQSPLSAMTITPLIPNPAYADPVARANAARNVQQQAQYMQNYQSVSPFANIYGQATGSNYHYAPTYAQAPQQSASYQQTPSYPSGLNFNGPGYSQPVPNFTQQQSSIDAFASFDNSQAAYQKNNAGHQSALNAQYNGSSNNDLDTYFNQLNIRR